MTEKRKNKPYQYTIIPGVKKQIAATMDHLKIKPCDPKKTVDYFIKQEKRFYMPRVCDKKNNQYFFKARLQDTDEVYRSAHKEIQFHKKIKPFAQQVRKHFIIPEYYDSGKGKNGFIWLKREYQNGSFAGNMDLDLGLTNQFFRKIKPANFAQALIAFQKLTPKVSKALKVPRHGFHWYQTDFQFYKYVRSLQRLYQEEVSFVEKFLKSQRSLVNKNANILSHGDLYPNNIMVNQKNQLVLFDWEMLNLNNAAFDPCFIYLLAWRNRNWQKQFLKSIYQKQKNKKLFKQLWQISLFSLTLRFLGHAQITRRQSYWRQMKKNGLSKKQLVTIRKKAQKTVPFHVKRLRAGIKQIDNFFKF